MSRYRKLEIQLRVKTYSLYLTTPKHSGGADIIGSAESPARAENTVQSAPFREILKRDQARTASGPGRLTQRVRTPQQ